MVDDLTRGQISNIVVGGNLIPANKFKLPFPRTALTRGVPDDEEYVIYNLSENVEAGTHWIASCNKKDSYYIEYFDSFGLDPPEDVKSYLMRSGKQLIYPLIELQGITETDCGYFCIYFLVNRFRGTSFYDCIYDFKRRMLDKLIQDRSS